MTGSEVIDRLAEFSQQLRVGLALEQANLSRSLVSAMVQILFAAVAVWGLSRFPGGAIEQSYLAASGRFLASLGAPLGLNWQLMVALLMGLVRKENSIATLGILYGGEAAGLAVGDFQRLLLGGEQHAAPRLRGAQRGAFR